MEKTGKLTNDHVSFPHHIKVTEFPDISRSPATLCSREALQKKRDGSWRSLATTGNGSGSGAGSSGHILGADSELEALATFWGGSGSGEASHKPAGTTQPEG